MFRYFEDFNTRTITWIIRFPMIHRDDSLSEFFLEFIRMLTSFEPIANSCNFLKRRISREFKVGNDEFILDRYEFLIHALWGLIDGNTIRRSLTHFLPVRTDEEVKHHDILFFLTECFLEPSTSKEIEILFSTTKFDIGFERY